MALGMVRMRELTSCPAATPTVRCSLRLAHRLSVFILRVVILGAWGLFGGAFEGLLGVFFRV